MATRQDQRPRQRERRLTDMAITPERVRRWVSDREPNPGLNEPRPLVARDLLDLAEYCERLEVAENAEAGKSRVVWEP